MAALSVKHAMLSGLYQRMTKIWELLDAVTVALVLSTTSWKSCLTPTI